MIKAMAILLSLLLFIIMVLITVIKIKANKENRVKNDIKVFNSFNEGVKKLYETACKVNKDNAVDAFNECLSILRKYTKNDKDNN